MKTTFRLLMPALLLAVACAPAADDEPILDGDRFASADDHGAHAALVESPASDAVGDADKPLVKVWKSPTCGCCAAWVERVREAGYPVEVVDVSNVNDVKREQGLPGHLASCHTALVDGYLVEGHVPLEDMGRMLAERPAIRGIAVPGMPTGAPGMEVPGVPADAYDVVAFTADGRTTVYEQH